VRTEPLCRRSNSAGVLGLLRSSVWITRRRQTDLQCRATTCSIAAAEAFRFPAVANILLHLFPTGNLPIGTSTPCLQQMAPAASAACRSMGKVIPAAIFLVTAYQLLSDRSTFFGSPKPVVWSPPSDVGGGGGGGTAQRATPRFSESDTVKLPKNFVPVTAEDCILEPGLLLDWQGHVLAKAGGPGSNGNVKHTAQVREQSVATFAGSEGQVTQSSLQEHAIFCIKISGWWIGRACFD